MSARIAHVNQTDDINQTDRETNRHTDSFVHFVRIKFRKFRANIWAAKIMMTAKNFLYILGTA